LPAEFLDRRVVVGGEEGVLLWMLEGGRVGGVRFREEDIGVFFRKL